MCASLYHRRYAAGMSLSVRQLLEQRHLGLVLVAEGAPGTLDAPVHWAHQSELSDSSPFTEPGEVLLTTGSHLPRSGHPGADGLDGICDDYVRRLRDSGVVAVGFGVGVHFDAVPEDLVRAAETHGLPLFEIPWELPFSAIVKAVSKSLSDAEQADLRRTNRAQRRLISAVGRANVTQSVVRSTAQIIGGWAALADAHGHVMVHTSAAALPLAEEALTAHRASARTVTFLDAEGGQVRVQTIVAGDGSVRGVLLAGSDVDLDPAALSTCMLASNLLGVYLSLSGWLDSALTEVRALLVEEALAGNPRPAQRAEGTLWPRVPHDPVQLVCVEGPTEALSGLRVDDLPAIWGRVEGRLWIVTTPAKQPKVSARVARQADLVQGSADPCSWQDLGGARHRALGALLRRDPSAGTSLVDLLPPEEGAAYVRSRLGPLMDSEAGDLLEALRAWVAEDGVIDRAAAVLGVHRHTVRRRMERVEELLGVDLSDPRTRHELWFACELLAAAADARPPGEASVSRSGSTPSTD